MKKNDLTHSEKAKNIRAIFTDVDGVLTDGKIIYDNHGNEFKHFNVKDGFIVRPLRESGIFMGVITGRESEVVKRRCEELKFDFHRHGANDKVSVLHEVLTRFGIKLDEVAYIGDDLPDLPALIRCGLACVPADAPSYVKEHAHMVTQAKGGDGVLREVGEFILMSQGKMGKLLEKYTQF